MPDIRRLLPRFRLRTLLILLSVVGVSLAFFAATWRSRERQYDVAAQLAKKGVRTFPAKKGNWLLRPPLDYVEVDEYLGIRNAPGRWEAVRRPSHERLTAADIAALAELPELRKLHLQGDVVEPAALAELAKLGTLRTLIISHYPLDDESLQQFAALKNLRELTLEATQVTDAGIERLREQLPQLEVYDD